MVCQNFFRLGKSRDCSDCRRSKNILYSSSVNFTSDLIELQVFSGNPLDQLHEMTSISFSLI